MEQHKHNLIFLFSLGKTWLRNNPYYTIFWLFMRYARRRLDKLFSNRSSIQSVPDEILEKLIAKRLDSLSMNFPTYECCVLRKVNSAENFTINSWHYVCSKITHKKYQVFVASYDDCESDKIVVSETMKYNMERVLGHELDDRSYFVMPIERKEVPIAAEARISMISNSCACRHDFVDRLLKTYFALPRYARAGDIFVVDAKKHAPDYFYSGDNCPSKVHFRVDAVRAKRKNAIERTARGCYIVKDETSLLQSSNVHAYIPPKFMESPKMELNLPMDLQVDLCSISNCPPFLEKPLSSLSTCVSPFLQNGIRMKIRPAFLVKGAPGSGKFKLIECLAKRNGLNFLSADFSEIQCPSASQTEAKLRIILQNARTCVPCVLRLSNIQTFGKNSEGKKDERIVRAFASELEKLNDDKSELPVIVIATLENDELEADVERLFIEAISIEHPNKSERMELLSWLLKTRGLSCGGNLLNVAGLVSDFQLTDLEALVVQTTKLAYQSLPAKNHEFPLILAEDDFIRACEMMQNSFSDRVGAPRIPKVHWEDIGGLASLKHEIKRRIELPMSNAMGLTRSGLLLYGPPGTGKTLLAKAVATECQLHFMSVKGPELLNMYVGQSEKNIRQVFERARAAAPCVIFFDELDSLAPNRGRSGDSGGVMDRVVSQLLAEMDGLDSAGSIFIIAATNRLDLIDAALLRPGRFDKMLYVGIYDDRDSQLSVLRAVTRRFRLKNDGDELREIVDKLPKNLTGADLYAVCSEAWLSAVRRCLSDLDSINDGKTKHEVLSDRCKSGIIVEPEDFSVAMENLVPSLSAAELARYERLGSEFSSAR